MNSGPTFHRALPPTLVKAVLLRDFHDRIMSVFNSAPPEDLIILGTERFPDSLNLLIILCNVGGSTILKLIHNFFLS